VATFELSGDRLKIGGILDTSAEAQLRDALQRLLDSGANVVTVDLSGVQMITSVCIGALVVLWIDLCEAGRQGKLLTSPSVKKVLDMTGLTTVLMDAASLAPPESG
jgi:anti-anti-sigma factor